ncbi:MAG: endo alpha-1,4 polygalactosaminidase [Vulcanimicrobiaceae bacterium]
MPIPFGEKVANLRSKHDTYNTMIIRSTGPIAILVLAAIIASASLPAPSVGAPWVPSVSEAFQSQLTGGIDTSAQASVYILDAFDTESPTVVRLHQRKDHVVCYVDAGTYEDWRPDAAAFQANPEVIGRADTGWSGEYWLDIRRIDVLAPIMQARFDMCKSKGFDSIEPDNIDGYQNQTGFPLTAADQLAYNRWLAGQAHARRMSIALKNDSDQTVALEPLFDWALVEGCYAQGWCSAVAPFVKAGKAAISVEYDDVMSPGEFIKGACKAATIGGYQTILKHRLLDAWRQTCS